MRGISNYVAQVSLANQLFRMVPMSLRAHPASYPICTEGPFLDGGTVT